MLKKAVLMLLVSIAQATAADKYTELQNLGPLPEYAVRTIKEKIVVDGNLSEPGWAQATPITLMFPWDFQTGKKQKTTVKLIRTADTLYVGYEAEDTDITATYENRDDPTYKDDCVEIFIKPSQETDSYFGMEMNAKGVLYDYFYPFPNSLDKNLNFENVQLKTTLRGTLNQRNDQDTGWTLEVAVPFKNFTQLSKQPAPKSGDQWRVQVNRWDGTEDSAGRRLSMWSHPGLKRANPHNPERFGVVVFK